MTEEMISAVSEEEQLLNETIMETFRKTGHKAPVPQNLEELFTQLSNEELTDLGRFFTLKGFRQKKKEEQISLLQSVYQDEQYWKNLFLFSSSENLQLFSQVMMKSPFKIKEYNSFFIRSPFVDVAVFSFDTADGLVAFVPNELQAIYQRVLTPEFQQEQKSLEIVKNYCLASLNLYGFISLERLFDLIFQRESIKVETSHIEDLIRGSQMFSNFAYVEDDMLISSCLDEDDSFEEIQEACEGVEPYLPSKEAFLAYADEEFYDENQAVLNLKDFLQTKTSNPELIQEALCCCNFSCRFGFPENTMFKDLENAEISIKKAKDILILTELFRDFAKHTRSWKKAGNTSAELAGDKMVQAVDTSCFVAPPTKNGPCTCGSGKKFKRCCGK